MKISVERKGDLSTNLEAYRRKIAPKVERGLRKGAEVILEESQALVPQDTQALHDSGHIVRIGSGLETVYIVGYGAKDFDSSGYGKDRIRRPPCEYAVYVHQMQVEFLLIPVMTKQQEMVAAINAEVK